ncbi:TetR/AcrR family transcriptional regulator [Nocardia vaccinii]|uniref:TetR/AcrR family transcriptional regulator n=1 Tax=Nocardia vaccinii TaxID=1822 RepID=UPI001FE16770|nr:helix-turn-helix domain-containing protein [Nocardia vaccinii]
MTNAPKLWRGQTLQDRSGERRGQLLDCAFDLLGTAGAGAVTMRAVIRQANLSPRYFYESFDNRETLLGAVYDRTEAALFERLSAITPGTDPYAAIRTALQTCADFFEEDPRRARVLLREPLADDHLRRHITQRTPAVFRGLAPLLGPAAETLFSSSDDTLATIGTALAGALTAVYLEWTDGHLTIEREPLVDNATTIVAALLGITVAP